VPASYEGRRADVVEVMTTRSVDGGLTWERPGPLPVPELVTGSPCGKIVALTDGMLLMAIYQSRLAAAPEQWEDESWLVRSTDDGRTWSEPTLIGNGYNETALLALPDDGVLAVLRGERGNDGLSVARSADGGRIWSAPTRLTEPGQHPAGLVGLADGSILLTYGNRNPPYRIEGRVSRDGGRTWLDVLLVFSGGRGVTVYYYTPSLQLAGRARVERRGPFYKPDDYLAVAVAWDPDAPLAALAELA
jgi:BNR repeat-like domain